MAARNKPIRCCAPPHHDRLTEEASNRLVQLAKVLADPTRLEILRLLAAQQSPVCACDIEALFDISQPTMSHHLKKLVTAKLVVSERSGLWAYYRIAPDAQAEMAGLNALLN